MWLHLSSAHISVGYAFSIIAQHFFLRELCILLILGDEKLRGRNPLIMFAVQPISSLVMHLLISLQRAVIALTTSSKTMATTSSCWTYVGVCSRILQD